jgi:site-specific recombinase XerD
MSEATQLESGEREERLRDFRRRFLGKSPSASTRRAYRAAIEQFEEFLEPRRRGLLDVGPPDIAAFRDLLTAAPRSLKPKSVYARLSTIRSFYKGLQREGLVAANPAASLLVAPPKVSPAPITSHLSPKQIEQLLAAPDRRSPAGARDYLILCLLAKMMLRAQEVRDLRQRDIVKIPLGMAPASETGLGVVVDARGTNRRVLPISREFKTVLDTYFRLDAEERRLCKGNYLDAGLIQGSGTKRTLGGEAISLRQLSNIVRKYGEYTGIPGLHPHCFRRTAVGDAIRQGADIADIKALAGYKAIETLHRYETE